jgi:hypothetical protein
MAKLIWAVICRRVLTDKETNTVSYIDGIEELKAAKLPSPCPPVVIGTLWRRNATQNSLSIRVRVIAGDSEVLVFEAPEIAMSATRHRVNIQLGGFPIDREGELSFVLEQRVEKAWLEVGRVPVDVQLVAASSSTRNAKKPTKKTTKNATKSRKKRSTK